MIHVLGSINIDYACSVTRLPVAGETVSGSDLVLTPGGKGANQALAARRAGAAVCMTGAVGRDEVAAQAISLLKESGVDLSAVQTVDGPTGCAFVFVDSSSENQIVVIPGANAKVSEATARSLPVASGDVLLLQHECPVSSVSTAAEHANRLGATVIANLAPYRTMPADFYHNVHILVVNETETAQLATDLQLDGSRDIPQQLATKLKVQLVQTLGSKGAMIVDSSGEKTAFSGIEVTAKDSVGAGDTFAGYLAAMLASGTSLARACEIANKAAALSCTRVGAQTEHFIY